MGVPRSPKRLLLFVHYNKWGGLADYVIYLLRHVRRVYSRVVFISNSPLAEEALSSLSGLCDDLVQRENKGFDFFAWKEALYREGKSELSCYDSVTLMNDTCFGPLFDLRAVYRRMEKETLDFWGLTSHRGAEQGMPITGGAVPEHIQSYFLCFNKSVLQSTHFWTFWYNVAAELEVGWVIKKYETQLTKYLAKFGFTYNTYFDIRSLDLDRDSFYFAQESVSYIHPEMVVSNRVPFLKIKSLYQNKVHENMFTLDYIAKSSAYPISLIHKHFEGYIEPDVSMMALSHDLRVCAKSIKSRKSILRIALHIHVLHLGVLKEMLNAARRGVHEPVDFFLTTDSEVRAQSIHQIMQEEFPDFSLRELCVCGDIGWDVWPWLQVAQRLMEYDVAGHMCTRDNRENVHSEGGSAWRAELMGALFGQFDKIYTAFVNDLTLGIVIPDIPTCLLSSPMHLKVDLQVQAIMTKLWRSMSCHRAVNFVGKSKFIFPCGNMFWYRPQALLPLTHAQWDALGMPVDFLSNDRTFLHALNRLPVYVAWSEGYGFKVVPINRKAKLAFHFNFAENVGSMPLSTLRVAIRHRLRENIKK